jgi:hypothetical protein
LTFSKYPKIINYSSAFAPVQCHDGPKPKKVTSGLDEKEERQYLPKLWMIVGLSWQYKAHYISMHSA